MRAWGREILVLLFSKHLLISSSYEFALCVPGSEKFRSVFIQSFLLDLLRCYLNAALPLVYYGAGRC